MKKTIWFALRGNAAFALTGLCVLFGLCASSFAYEGGGYAQHQRAKYFCAKGTVVAIDDDRSGVTLKHGRIEGFMEAMTMHFKVDETEVLEGIRPGNAVRFTLRDTPEKTRLVFIEKLPVDRKGERE